MKQRGKARPRSQKTYKDNHGYRRFKDSNIPVHQHAAEKKLGRPLKAGEVVHHKNRNKLDNSPGNLHVFSSQAEHWAAHKKDARKYGWDYSLNGKAKYS
ncbi:MAG: HNH endonuclease [Candidatus Tokpelaia sp.]|nr:MAG: HNH endonuclease [Candidatus Tokpelaia sp.]KAA6206781.1 MAG: HNH endonuclease [Candidatus Tokpelaia sp.]